ncbi:alanine racemase [Jonesia quinghaiensis]|uniref:alanine racemase n=1 Tax=Jonesia quinghaiensis TaxID=262806 RepID=UPI0003F56E5C|nr:alanine racemase [Jonesia quinghaiensis]
MARMTQPTLHILTSAVAHNVATVRARTHAAVMAVVKADGYGHGAVTVATSAVAAGATQLGTTSLREAVTLREAGLREPIVVWLNPEGLDAETAAAHRIDVAVGSVDELTELLATPANNPVGVHLHVDTGMAREGCPRAEWEKFFALATSAQQQGRITVVALMGHLPRADYGDPTHNADAVAQIRVAQALAAAAGLGTPPTHMAATSGALTDPSTHFDTVRVGAGLVGIDPSNMVALHGASRLTAPIVHSATLDAGTPVGYDGSYVTTHTTHVSVLPVGYADGIPRSISPGAHVAVHNQRYPVIGRVSMDQIVIDTGETSFPIGTKATVFGPSGGATPTIQEWATWAGTIPHTIVTSIGPRVQRTVV